MRRIRLGAPGFLAGGFLGPALTGISHPRTQPPLTIKRPPDCRRAVDRCNPISTRLMRKRVRAVVGAGITFDFSRIQAGGNGPRVKPGATGAGWGWVVRQPRCGTLPLAGRAGVGDGRQDLLANSVPAPPPASLRPSAKLRCLPRQGGGGGRRSPLIPLLLGRGSLVSEARSGNLPCGLPVGPLMNSAAASNRDWQWSQSPLPRRPGVRWGRWR